MIRRYSFVWLSMVGLLGSCSVYVPMQGAAPEIRRKGEVEVAGSWSLTNRLDAGATYSPMRHLLVRAAASTKGGSYAGNDSIQHVQNNQYELGVGTYWPLGQSWLVGGLAGFGQAHARARYDGDGGPVLFPSQSYVHQFEAVYSKYSGEAYFAYQPSPLVSLGMSYRLVQLRLTDVTDQGVAVRSAPILRQEPMFFFRLRPASTEGLLQLQLAIGGSATLGYSEQTADDRADPTRQFKLGRSYLSLGVAFYPHLLWQKK